MGGKGTVITERGGTVGCRVGCRYYPSEQRDREGGYMCLLIPLRTPYVTGRRVPCRWRRDGRGYDWDIMRGKSTPEYFARYKSSSILPGDHIMVRHGTRRPVEWAARTVTPSPKQPAHGRQHARTPRPSSCPAAVPRRCSTATRPRPPPRGQCACAGSAARLLGGVYHV